MACFAAPTTVAIFTTLFRKKFPEQWHIGWLNAMIWGGAAALTVEHVAHGEIVPWPPFLTAMSSPAETVVMLQEIASVGIPMTIALVVAWFVMVIIYEQFIAVDRRGATARAAAR